LGCRPPGRAIDPVSGVCFIQKIRLINPGCSRPKYSLSVQTGPKAAFIIIMIVLKWRGWGAAVAQLTNVTTYCTQKGLHCICMPRHVRISIVTCSGIVLRARHGRSSIGSARAGLQTSRSSDRSCVWGVIHVAPRPKYSLISAKPGLKQHPSSCVEVGSRALGCRPPGRAIDSVSGVCFIKKRCPH
jgi:hypothetical protein